MRASLQTSALAAVLVCLVVPAGDAQAATAKRSIPRDDEPLWEVALGGYGRYGPAYPASDDYIVNIIPLPFPIYRGRYLRVGDERDKPVRTRIFRRDRIKLDLDFGLNLPASSDDVDAREGLDDLDLLFEVGPELQLQFEENLPGDFFLALQTRGAWSFGSLNPDWRGIIVGTEFKYEVPLGKSSYGLRITPEFATSDYMDYFYGISEKDATPDRPAFDASSGYLGTRVILSYGREFTPKVEMRTGVRIGFYNGARNDDSPLFTADNNAEFYAAFLWKFWESKRRASAP